MNQIEEHLYLGDWNDGVRSSYLPDIMTICVIETPEYDRYERMGYYCPILEHDAHSLAFVPPRANIDMLDRACDIIDRHLLEGRDLLVHCWAGIERSPLTLAYWLIRSNRRVNLDGAYRFLKHIRPEVEDRREWLPREVY